MDKNQGPSDGWTSYLKVKKYSQKVNDRKFRHLFSNKIMIANFLQLILSSHRLKKPEERYQIRLEIISESDRNYRIKTREEKNDTVDQRVGLTKY